MAAGQDVPLPTGQSQYQVVGCLVPNEKYGEGHAQCKVYRMKPPAKNKVVAPPPLGYFMGRLCRVKKANGQTTSISQAPPPARARLRASRPPLPAPAPRCCRLAPGLAGASACLRPGPWAPRKLRGADAAVPGTTAAAGAAQFCERHRRARAGRRAAPRLPRRAPLLASPPLSPQIYEKSLERVKNYGVWFRYESRTGTANAHKEFREMSADKAINHLYQNMVGLAARKAA